MGREREIRRQQSEFRKLNEDADDDVGCLLNHKLVKGVQYGGASSLTNRLLEEVSKMLETYALAIPTSAIIADVS
jgi:hypothetical protein